MNFRLSTLNCKLLTIATIVFVFSTLIIGATFAYAATTISSCTDLENISLSGDYELNSTIDCTGVTLTPIGNTGTNFTGTFNGKGNSITNFEITTSDPTLGIGLFGASDGTIKNLNIVDAIINAPNGESVGLAVGSNSSNGIIENVNVSGTVTGRDGIGGLVGNSFGTVTNSSADVDVTANFYGGGLVGGQDGGTISDSYATGDVIDNGLGDSGGFVGYSNGTITSSYSSGNVTGTSGASSYIGGFAGTITGTVTNSFASGNASSIYDYVGGFVGEALNGATITDCHATGDVSNTGFLTGGFVGNAAESTIERSYATGTVTSTSDSVGGFSGNTNNNSTIRTSFATGDVSGGLSIGGFSGYIRGTIENCFARGNVNGSQYVGGFVGLINNGTLSNSYSTGEVTGNSVVGGFIGFYGGNNGSNNFWDNESSGMSTSGGSETGKTTIEMKDVATFTDLATAGLSSPWDFADNPNDDNANNDYWSIDKYHNDNYPYLNNVYTLEDDTDGISPEVEDAGPNNGDANNDGTKDYLQSNVATYKISSTNKYLALEVSSGCLVFNIESSAESTSKPDNSFNYPNLLHTFSLTGCSSNTAYLPLNGISTMLIMNKGCKKIQCN
ncbi:MAG: GLUG motif-containing protein [Acidimicrobiia bacterium]